MQRVRKEHDINELNENDKKEYGLKEWENQKADPNESSERVKVNWTRQTHISCIKRLNWPEKLYRGLNVIYHRAYAWHIALHVFFPYFGHTDIKKERNNNISVCPKRLSMYHRQAIHGQMAVDLKFIFESPHLLLLSAKRSQCMRQ